MVNLVPVTNFRDEDDQFFGSGRVNVPIVAVPNSIQVNLAGEFLDVLRAWMSRECAEAFDDSLLNRLSERFE